MLFLEIKQRGSEVVIKRSGYGYRWIGCLQVMLECGYFPIFGLIGILVSEVVSKGTVGGVSGSWGWGSY